jgi:hypothetical protein
MNSVTVFILSEVDFDQPLPPPKAAANTLKASALRAIQQWNDKFGEAYKKLSLGFNFLQKCKKVRSDEMSVVSLHQTRISYNTITRFCHEC